MSSMFEVQYVPPADPRREAALHMAVAEFGGRLDYREEPAAGGICLTYEFDAAPQAAAAAAVLRTRGEHVEGPTIYGD